MVGNRWILAACAAWTPCDASTSPVRLAAVALRGQLVTQAPDALAAVALCGQLLAQLT